jgi:hypothetical protein
MPRTRFEAKSGCRCATVDAHPAPAVSSVSTSLTSAQSVIELPFPS